MLKNRILIGVCLVFGLAFSTAFLFILPAIGGESASVHTSALPLGTNSVIAQISAQSGLDPALVAQMLAWGVPAQEINSELAAEWPAHLAKLAIKQHPKINPQHLSEVEMLAREAIVDTSQPSPSTAEDELWLQIEATLNRNDTATVIKLASGLPDNQRQQLIKDINPPSLKQPAQPDAPIIGRNGDPCLYYDYNTAMNDADNGDIIYTDQGSYSMVIGTITKTLTFAPSTNSCQTPASGGVTLDAGGTSRVALINTGNQVTFTNLILTNGSNLLGGILYVSNNSTIALDNTDLTNGISGNKGGALRIIQATAYMLNGSKITDNSTTVIGDGGGVAIDHGTLVMRDDSRIGDYLHGNTSANRGGGLYMNGGTLHLYDTSRIRSNTAASNGGGVYATNSAIITLSDNAYIGYVTSTSNNNAYDGGGVFLTGSGSQLHMQNNSSVQNNYASHYGGGIYIAAGARADIDSSSVNYNETNERGGGILVDGTASVNIHNGSALNYNLASDIFDAYGAGMYILNNGAVVTVSASTVMSNTSAVEYGGIRLSSNGSLLINQDTSILRNHARGGFGGGLAVTGTVTLDAVSILSNTALYSGGGLYINGGNAVVTDPDIRFNQAGNHGAGIYRSGGELHLSSESRDAMIAVNLAAVNGGGIYDWSGKILHINSWNGHTFAINTNSADNGGGVFLTHGSRIDAYGSVELTSNQAITNGGAIYAEDSPLVRFNDFGEGLYIPKMLVNDAYHGNGGGIYAINSSVFLYRVQIGHPVNGNNAHLGNGGGIYLEHSNLEAINTIIQNNHAGNDGGGVAAVLTSTVIVDSYFPDIPPHPYTECDPNSLLANHYCTEFRTNLADSDGGGIYADHSTVSVEHTAFLTNTAHSGSALTNQYGLADLYDSLFTGNDATGPNNSTTWIYAGSTPGGSATLNAMNNTWADNADLALTYALYTGGNFNNNLIWGNDGHGSITPNATAACNDTQNTALPGIGNISQNPLFTSSSRGAFHLGLTSAAIDRCASGTDLDLDNVSRPKGASYDMGAFESNWSVLYLPVLFMNYP